VVLRDDLGYDVVSSSLLYEDDYPDAAPGKVLVVLRCSKGSGQPGARCWTYKKNTRRRAKNSIPYLATVENDSEDLVDINSGIALVLYSLVRSGDSVLSGHAWLFETVVTHFDLTVHRQLQYRVALSRLRTSQIQMYTAEMSDTDGGRPAGVRCR
jgi:hypothetical protein